NRGYFLALAARAATEITSEGGPASAMFLNCADLYFGTVGALNNNVPDADDLLAAIIALRETDTSDFASMASSRIQQEHEPFCQLATSLRSGIGIDQNGDRLHNIAYAGAGVAHIVTMRALGVE